MQNEMSARKGEISAVVEKLMEKHKVVASFFASDAGVHLMALESAIAEDIMLAFARKGHVCLPLHDSFLCESKYKDELDAQMHESYEKVLAARQRPRSNTVIDAWGAWIKLLVITAVNI